jgi:hypothetical protein
VTASPDGGMAERLRKLTDIVIVLAERLDGLETQLRAGSGGVPGAVPWLWLPGPNPGGGEPGQERDLARTLETFVGWYNAVYVGTDGSRARPIPACWPQHPGLAMEIATLAYTWWAANTGRTANIRDAQQWHHQWRPAFTDRLLSWVHPHCLDGHHRAVGAEQGG